MPLSKTRWAATPDTPTFDGAGVPGLRASFWHGLWAPRGTPKDGIATLHAEPQCDRRKATHRASLPFSQSRSCAWEHWK
jgi:Tripartite tricarboxylate transporter family receptor